MSQPFVHLRLHSEFSINDGIVRIKPVTAAAAGMQMPAMAITDNNNLFGLIKFYGAAAEAGVKPIVACDVWIASETENEDPTPLVLFARNEKGYRNLSELLSKAYLEGQHLGRANLKKSWIADQADGLIALSAGHTGDVGRALLNGKPDEARRLAQRWMDIFPDAYYLELHRTGKAGEEEYISRAVDLAFALDCPVVATNDVRFLRQDEFEAHEVRVCIHDSRTLNDPRRERKYTNQQYLKSAEEMRELFSINRLTWGCHEVTASLSFGRRRK